MEGILDERPFLVIFLLLGETFFSGNGRRPPPPQNLALPYAYDDSNNISYEMLSILGCRQHVEGVTHIRGSTLELVITAKDRDIVSTCIIGELLSDYYVINFNLAIRIVPEKYMMVKKRTL